MIVEATVSAVRLRVRPVVALDSDSGARLFGGQLAEVWGTSLDGKWLYVEAPAGRGWASKQYLKDTMPSVAGGVLLPGWPTVPTGLRGIIATFGEAGAPQCSAGRVMLPQSLPYSWQTGAASIIACHKLIEDVLGSVFWILHRKGLWDLLEDFGGCYEPRLMKEQAKPSTHAWGIAVDLNTRSNPLGAKPAMSGRIVSVFEDHGFVWGGRWARPDGMHFQFCHGY